MLKILDKYTIKKLLSSFFLLIITIIMVVMLIDFSERIDGFLKEDAPLNEVVFNHYSNWIPSFNIMIWSLSALVLVVILVKLFGRRIE